MRDERAGISQHIAFLLAGVLVVRLCLRLLFRSGTPRPEFPRTGGFLIVCNHRSFMDPVLAAAFMRRSVSFFARASLWRIPVIRQCMDVFGGLPIDRGEPQMAVMQRTIRWLRAGRIVMLFPEGTRTRTGRLGRLRPGFAVFARRAAVPVLPVYVHGTERAWPRSCPLPIPGRRIAVHYGPMIPPPDPADRDADARLVQRVERWMHEHEARLLGPPPRRPAGDPPEDASGSVRRAG